MIYNFQKKNRDQLQISSFVMFVTTLQFVSPFQRNHNTEGLRLQSVVKTKPLAITLPFLDITSLNHYNYIAYDNTLKVLTIS